MARKANHMTWMAICVMVVLSVGFAGCSDDDNCKDNSCTPADSGPDKDVVRKDGIQADEGEDPDQKVGNCPAKGVVFNCYEDAAGKKGKGQAQVWTSLGLENPVTTPITCGMVKSDILKTKSWFVYDKVTQEAKNLNMKLTCNPAK